MHASHKDLTMHEAVDRDASGVPKAFRIWANGWTHTDKGDHLFDELAASRLLEEQACRGNRYSVDYDHLSLSDLAPPEARIAAGSFRLEVRRDRNGKPELWATDCRWTSKARAGLIAGEWPSMSPAYDVDTKTRRVTGFLNIALTGNPATHNAPRLSLAASASGRARIAANRLQSATDVSAVVASLESQMSFDDIL
jgi:phage I-like protein